MNRNARKRRSETPLTQDDAQAFARAFGFRSTEHLGNVLAGREPSALVDERARAADLAAAELRKQRADQRRQEECWARDKVSEQKAAAQ
jgi:hypothetical protein